jgi:hypothetical protein
VQNANANIPGGNVSAHVVKMNQQVGDKKKMFFCAIHGIFNYYYSLEFRIRSCKKFWGLIHGTFFL